LEALDRDKAVRLLKLAPETRGLIPGSRACASAQGCVEDEGDHRSFPHPLGIKEPGRGFGAVWSRCRGRLACHRQCEPAMTAACSASAFTARFQGCGVVTLVALFSLEPHWLCGPRNALHCWPISSESEKEIVVGSGERVLLFRRRHFDPLALRLRDPLMVCAAEPGNGIRL
jgi:hypothetical protein